MAVDGDPCPLESNDDASSTPVLADPELLAQGWTRRNFEEPTHAKELVELYQSLGYEVRIEALKPESFPDQCQTCGLSVCSSYVLIYTRKSKPAKP